MRDPLLYTSTAVFQCLGKYKSRSNCILDRIVMVKLDPAPSGQRFKPISPLCESRPNTTRHYSRVEPETLNGRKTMHRDRTLNRDPIEGHVTRNDVASQQIR
jgi:hypothetical protein